MRSIRSITAVLRFAFLGTTFLCAIVLPSRVAAETGAEAWLRYSALSPQAAKSYERLPDKIVLLGDSSILNTAQQELVRGVSQMLGRKLLMQAVIAGAGPCGGNQIVLGTMSELHVPYPDLRPDQTLTGDGYWLRNAKIHGRECLLVAGGTDRGVLYGAFALLSKIARAENIANLDESQQPYAPIRWVNQWETS